MAGRTGRGHLVAMRLGNTEEHHESGHPKMFWLPVGSECKRLLNFVDLHLVVVCQGNMLDLNVFKEMSLAKSQPDTFSAVIWRLAYPKNGVNAMTLPISALSFKAELNITLAEQTSKGGGKIIEVWATFSCSLYL